MSVLRGFNEWRANWLEQVRISGSMRADLHRNVEALRESVMKKPSDVSRRDFIRDAAKTAAGVAVGAGAAGMAKRADGSVYKSILPSTIMGANEKIRTGHIGVGGMGTANLRFVLERDDIQPVAVCDLWPPHRERAAEMVSQKWDKPSQHKDFREIIDNDAIDAVVIVTPDHWHAIPSIAACDAGKDVWCEKPLATTIEEGRHMVEAARRNNTVFQAGTMQRSSEVFQEAVQMVQEGYLGDVAHVECYIHDGEPVEGIGQGSTEKPEELDWEFHQGWTELVPFNSNRWLYNFRWFLDYSGGKMTDWGAHLVDIAVWAMGEDKAPKNVNATGGKFLMTDNRTTPDTLNVSWEFDDYVLTFTNRVWSNYIPEGYANHGIIFHGTNATMVLSRSGYRVIPQFERKGGKPNPDAAEAKERRGTGMAMHYAHWQNFVDCIRSRKRPICDVAVCHNTTTVCHMGTCSFVAGEKLHWDAEKEKFYGGVKKATKKANNFAYREYQNGWKLG